MLDCESFGFVERRRLDDAPVQTAKLLASDAAAYDYFGGSVAISGDLVVVGAYGDYDADASSGSAYIFETTGNDVATPRPSYAPS